MKRQILVALDGSPLAETVLSDAVGIAKASGSGLVLLRVVPIPIYIEPMGGIAPEAPEMWESWEEEVKVIRGYLDSVAEKLRPAGLVVETVALEGDPASCILDYISTKPDITLVAIATHGRSGVGRWIFGSVAERVLHSSPIPLLMVRSAHEHGLHGLHGLHMLHTSTGHDAAPGEAKAAVKTYKSIIVPLDGSKLAEQALEHAQELALEVDGQITLISVVPPVSAWERNVATSNPLWLATTQKARINQMQDYLLDVAQPLRASGYKVRTIVEEGDPAETIINAADHADVDLVVMTTHGRSGIERMWLGSVAMKVVRGTTKPVMLERPKERIKARVEEAVARKLEKVATSGRVSKEPAHRAEKHTPIPGMTPVV